MRVFVQTVTNAIKSPITYWTRDTGLLNLNTGTCSKVKAKLKLEPPVFKKYSDTLVKYIIYYLPSDIELAL